MKYQISPDAQRDIREITRHIRVKQQSPQNAQLVGSRLKRAFQSLARTPSLGHRRAELERSHLRVLPVTGLLVIYNPNSNPLAILRVVHGARDLTGINTRP